MISSNQLKAVAPEAGGRFSTLARDVLAGLVAAIALVTLATSYAALIFPGDLVAAAPRMLWAILLGIVVCGAIMSLTTSLPPIGCGLDIPTTALMIVLSAAVADTMRRADRPADEIALTIMVIFSAISLLTAVAALVIGTFKFSNAMRLVPASVVAGFLAATGWLLMVNGLKLVLERPMTLAALMQPIDADQWLRLLVAAGCTAGLFAARALIKGPYTIPVAIIVGAAVLDLILQSHYGTLAAARGWYLKGFGAAAPWSPVEAVRGGGIDWRTVLSYLPEVVAITIVGIMSLVVKVVGVETQRTTSGDLDGEFRRTGFANLVGIPFGTMPISLLLSPTRLLTEAGAATRWAGVAASLIVAAVVVLNLNLPAVVPIAVLAALVIVNGYALFSDSLRQMVRARDWASLAFASVVMVICVSVGYIQGVLLGFLGACLMFAVSYSRVGIISRHVTRAQFSSHVDYGRAINKRLAASGDAIHVICVRGYVFFGSSDTLFEQLKAIIEAPRETPIIALVLDFSACTGIDASAIVSLSKLRAIAGQRGVLLAFSGLAPDLERALAREDVFAPRSPHRAFVTRNEALAWCERRLIDTFGAVPVPGDNTARDADQLFNTWLTEELGSAEAVQRLLPYLQRRGLDGPVVLYKKDEVADALDFLSAGALAITLHDAQGRQQTVRRMLQLTIVGEIGFFSTGLRSATVAVEGPTVVFTLSRAAYERLKAHEPALAAALLTLVVGTLAERLEFSNTEVAALL